MFAALNSPFHVAVINDEVDQDFAKVVDIVSKEFGMQWIELRGMWKKNVMDLDDQQLAEASRLLDAAKLRVTDIASPVFKVDWPGAPRSKSGPKRDTFNADFTFKQQDELLEKSFDLAKRFNTDRVRIFDFWRLEDQKPYRKEIDDKLREAADKAAKRNIILIIENEHECNTGTGAEAARTLNAVQSRNFMLNWDPGNATMLGEVPYPDGFNQLPKDRIGHVHCKDSVKNATGKVVWAAMGKGQIDWVGQFRALKQMGYHHATSLETHWRGAGTPEESTRQSWAGMKQELEQAGALS
ncbi:MAG: sugar phosphate isomerase/epimerase [Acidobacteria bacterium]|nr:sugar phosphate isomerase/epimerase [Acidobacteriota bacterium]MBV9437348.1 sugar phosphate isomerase/epimerase [Acidobacteriota bacterium]